MGVTRQAAQKRSPQSLCQGSTLARASHRSNTMGRAVVESAWGAVPALLPVRFPRPLAEPGVRLSTHPALHDQLLGSACCR
jgi:hypothetical protein